jgi:hypothetical protein
MTLRDIDSIELPTAVNSRYVTNHLTRRDRLRRDAGWQVSTGSYIDISNQVFRLVPNRNISVDVHGQGAHWIVHIAIGTDNECITKRRSASRGASRNRTHASTGLIFIGPRQSEVIIIYANSDNGSRIGSALTLNSPPIRAPDAL